MLFRSSTWLPRSRVHLYKTVLVWIDFTVDLESYHRFMDELAMNPRNGSLVQEMSLRCERDVPDSTSLFAITLPNLLPNLKYLHLVWMRNYFDTPPDFFSSLSRFASLRSFKLCTDLSSFTLGQYCDLLNTISGHITHFALEMDYHRSRTLDGEPIQSSLEAGASFSELRLAVSNVALNLFLSWIQPSPRCLTLDIDSWCTGQEFCDMCQFVQSCGSSLEELTLVVHDCSSIRSSFRVYRLLPGTSAQSNFTTSSGTYTVSP